MRQIKFSELMTELFDSVVNDKPTSFDNVYLKDDDGNSHMVQQADLMDDRFRCEDSYYEDYEWLKEQENVPLYVD